MSRVEAALQDLARLDDLAEGHSWLHRIDARAKIVVTLVYVVAVASWPPRAVVELLPLAAYPLVLFLGARLPVSILRRPVLLALLLALAVGAANPLLDRQPVRLGTGTAIAGGWFSLVSILLRAVLCVAAAMALVATTGIGRLAHGLRQLGVPRIAVTQLLFLYRYAFLLGSNVHAMSRARELRGGGRPLQLAAYGPLVGHLLLRTLDRAERIHQAMCCRGFRGDVPVGGESRFGGRDWAFLVGWCGFLALVRGGWLIGRLGGLLWGGVS
jgi:cobalt/nickel transport system permease protein